MPPKQHYIDKLSRQEYIDYTVKEYLIEYFGKKLYTDYIIIDSSGLILDNKSRLRYEIKEEILWHKSTRKKCKVIIKALYG